MFPPCLDNTLQYQSNEKLLTPYWQVKESKANLKAITEDNTVFNAFHFYSAKKIKATALQKSLIGFCRGLLMNILHNKKKKEVIRLLFFNMYNNHLFCIKQFFRLFYINSCLMAMLFQQIQ